MSCNCKQKLLLKIKPGASVTHAFLEIPTFDLAFTLKMLEIDNEECYWNLCEGFGNTNYADMVAQYQICIAALELYTVGEMLDMISIRDGHFKH